MHSLERARDRKFHASTHCLSKRQHHTLMLDCKYIVMLLPLWRYAIYISRLEYSKNYQL